MKQIVNKIKSIILARKWVLFWFCIGVIFSFTVITIWRFLNIGADHIKLTLPPTIHRLVEIDSVETLEATLNEIDKTTPLEVGTLAEIECNDDCFTIYFSAQIVKYFACKYEDQSFDLKSNRFLSNIELSDPTLTTRFLLFIDDLELKPQTIMKRQPQTTMVKIQNALNQNTIAIDKDWPPWLVHIVMPTLTSILAGLVVAILVVHYQEKRQKRNRVAE